MSRFIYAEKEHAAGLMQNTKEEMAVHTMGHIVEIIAQTWVCLSDSLIETHKMSHCTFD